MNKEHLQRVLDENRRIVNKEKRVRLLIAIVLALIAGYVAFETGGGF